MDKEPMAIFEGNIGQMLANRSSGEVGGRGMRNFVATMETVLSNRKEI
jgi:hypothetical protein